MNILLITTDQQRADTLGAYGSPLGATPNLDQMAQEGARFGGARCQHPYCQPSRWSILTGQHPRTHGVWSNAVDPTEEQIADALSTRLTAAGYRTGFVGKAHLATHGVFRRKDSPYIEAWPNAARMEEGWEGPYMGFEKVDLLALGHYPAGYGPLPMGLHYGRFLAEGSRIKSLRRFWQAGPFAGLSPRRSAPQTWNSALPEELHPTSWVTDQTIARLREFRGRPFFLWASFADPHFPFDPPAPWCFKYDWKDMPLPRRDLSELDGKPPIQARFAKGTAAGFPNPLNPAGGKLSDRQLGEIMAAYYAMVAQIDAGVGQILTALEGMGLADDTLVAFTTDHGELMGDHCLMFKGPFHYEGLLKVPLLLRGPGVPKGTTTADPVGLIDLVPTFEASAGLAPSGRVQGKSLLPLLSGEASREVVLTENENRFGFREYVQTLTGRRYKLSRSVGHDYGELYDLSDDPGELENRWSETASAKLKADLTAELDSLLPEWNGPQRPLLGFFPA